MRKSVLLGVLAIIAIAIAAAAYFWHSSRNQATLIDQAWANHDPESTIVLNHDAWQLLLDDYLVTDEVGEAEGVNLFDYSGLLDDGREPLDEYVDYLVSVDPATLNLNEQKAYWFNVYNAVTVQLIVDNFPVASITQLGSGGVTTFGPWDDKLITINGASLSLNEVEHGIIRPLYDDYRIHFAVNCASIGCPNLSPEPFSGENLDAQLDAAAEDYVRHSRGVRFEGEQLHLSTLFDWYADDFGEDLPSVLATLGQHATDETRAKMLDYQGTPEYFYDWSLNGYCFVDDACGG